MTTKTSAAESKRHTSFYAGFVKCFSWNTEKNKHLKKERRISFEEVVFHIQHRDLLDILNNAFFDRSFKAQRTPNVAQHR